MSEENITNDESDLSTIMNNLSIEGNDKLLEKLLELIGPTRKNTYKYFIKEYFEKKDLNEWISVGEVGDYCSTRRKEETGKPFGDPPREFEAIRKDKSPGYWEERTEGMLKYVKFKIPTEEDILVSKDHGFDKIVINAKLEKCKNKCEITGLPSSESKLAADHWFPKEKGGDSNEDNCIILNKILNEKKNNHLPEDWFCKHLLTNFLNICKRMGNLDEIKLKLIKFIQDF